MVFCHFLCHVCRLNPGRTKAMKPFQDLRTQWKLARRSRKKMRFSRFAEIILLSYAKSGRTWLSVMISHIAHQKFGTPAEQLISSSEFREGNP